MRRCADALRPIVWFIESRNSKRRIESARIPICGAALLRAKAVLLRVLRETGPLISREKLSAICHRAARLRTSNRCVPGGTSISIDKPAAERRVALARSVPTTSARSQLNSPGKTLVSQPRLDRDDWLAFGGKAPAGESHIAHLRAPIFRLFEPEHELRRSVHGREAAAGRLRHRALLTFAHSFRNRTLRCARRKSREEEHLAFATQTNPESDAQNEDHLHARAGDGKIRDVEGSCSARERTFFGLT